MSQQDKSEWIININQDGSSGQVLFINSNGMPEWSPSTSDLLQELINTPVLKIPFWIEQNKEKLKKVGITIKEEKCED